MNDMMYEFHASMRSCYPSWAGAAELCSPAMHGSFNRAPMMVNGQPFDRASDRKDSKRLEKDETSVEVSGPQHMPGVFKCLTAQ